MAYVFYNINSCFFVKHVIVLICLKKAKIKAKQYFLTMSFKEIVAEQINSRPI